MARKKKIKNTETNVQTVKDVSQVSGTQDISYAGVVTIKLQHGKKTIMSKKYHNNGMPDLFKFLCLALAGSYTEALRPCKIKLFCYDAAFAIGQDTADPTKFNWATAFSDDNKPRQATPFIVYDTTPVVSKKVDRDDKISYETTFHFRIPGSLINSDIINVIGLYSNNIYAGRESEASAYYLLQEKNEETKKMEWAPIELGEDKIGGNYSLIIDWTMSVTNKETN